MTHRIKVLTLALTLAFPTGAALAQTKIQTIEGYSRGGRFGSDVTTIGDIDNDGETDYVVSIPLDDTAGPDAGRVTIISGATGSTIWSRNGENAGDQFGFSISRIEDQNGDGTDEVIVGAPYFDNVGASDGRVQVLNGGSGAVLLTLNGGASGDRFGYRVLGVHLPTNPTTTGFLVSAPYRDPGSVSAAGSVYVYRYNSGALVFSHEFAGTQTNEHMGMALTVPELDTNNDGQVEYAFGAPDYDSASIDVGRVLFFRATTPFNLVTTLPGNNPGARFGAALTSILDHNGDSVDDLAVGAPEYNNGRGAVSVLSSVGLSLISFLTGSNVDDHFGAYVSSAQTFAPGIPATKTEYLMVGIPGADAGGTDAGQVKVYKLPSTLVLTASGTSAGGEFGTSVSGFSAGLISTTWAFVAGAPGVAIDGAEQGRIVRYDTTSMTLSYNGSVSGDQLGTSVAIVGDVNGDGRVDWAVGAPYTDHVISAPFPGLDENSGSVRVISGANYSILYTVYGSQSDNLGYSLAAAGDVNKDGFADFVVGAPNLSTGAVGNGFARVFSGVNGSTIWTLTSPAADDDFGWSVAGVGDLNNDTYPDVVIGAPKNDTYATDGGAAFAYSGQTGALLWTAKNFVSTSRFGYAVAGLGGDLNGDGKLEVIVGAPYSDVNATNAGAIYIVNGSNGNNMWTKTHTVANDLFGTSVAGAGDVNGDGVSDALVGIPGFDNVTQLNNGAVRALSGVNVSTIFTYRGTEFDMIGTSVANIGDIDIDGVDDFATGGTQIASIVNYGPGVVDVVSGKTGTPVYSFTGANTLDFFGMSVGGGGDLDGDGIHDLVIGAPFADPNGNSSGCAYRYSLRPKGVTFFGTGSAGCTGPEFLTTNLPAKINTPSFQFRGDQAPVNSLGLLLVTNSADYAGSDSLGIGVILHVDFFAATEVYGIDMTSNANGFGVAPSPIPNNPGLLGANYFAQVAWVWASCPLPPYGLSTSSAVQMVIGN